MVIDVVKNVKKRFSSLHHVGLRPRIYYTVSVTNFRGGGGGGQVPFTPPQCSNLYALNLSFRLTINSLLEVYIFFMVGIGNCMSGAVTTRASLVLLCPSNICRAIQGEPYLCQKKEIYFTKSRSISWLQNI